MKLSPFIKKFFLLILLFTHSMAFASSLTQIKEATQTLLDRAHQIKNGQQLTPAETTQLIAVAKTRQIALNETAITQTNAVMNYLLPDAIVSIFPSAIQNFLEHPIVTKGTLEVRQVLYPNGEKHLQYFLNKNNVYKNLYFAHGLNDDLKTGDEINIKAYALNKDQLLVHAKEISVQSMQPNAIPTSLGEQKTVVIAVFFKNKPSDKPWNVTQINSIFFTNVNSMFSEYSYGQTSVTGQTLGWYKSNLNNTISCADVLTAIPAAAEDAAKKANVDLSPYKHRVYVFPKTSCSWSSMGDIGTPANGYSKAWFNGTLNVKLAAFELGHNLGLNNANLLKCDNSPDQGNCVRVPQGDNTDVMGGATTAHFNAFQKDRLGWLNYQASPPIQTITKTGSYFIDAFETKNNNVKALKVLKKTLPDGSNDYYYLEYRQGIGFDLPLANCGANCDYTKGVVFHIGNSVKGDSSDVLDMSPASSTNFIALLPGQSYSNKDAPNGGVTFELSSVSSSGATMKVTMGEEKPVCEKAIHEMSIAPAQTQWINAGQNVNYTVTLKNNDSVNCTASNFIVTTNVPTNLLTTSLSEQWVTLAPGASKTIAVNVASLAGITTGIYPVGITATNSGKPVYVVANVGINP